MKYSNRRIARAIATGRLGRGLWLFYRHDDRFQRWHRAATKGLRDLESACEGLMTMQREMKGAENAHNHATSVEPAPAAR